MRLDSVPRNQIRIGGRGRSAFLVCGWSGFSLAVVTVTWLSAAAGLSVAVQAAIAASAVGVYVAVAAAARRVLGRAVLIYYHHILVFLACSALIAWILGAPVLAHLDVTVCGLAAFTALARVGCLMVGCCHGRPAGWGIAYGPDQVRTGVPAYLVRLRLLPVQGIESAVCALLCAGGVAAVLAGAPAGTAFAVFICGYAVARFGIEWLRGDPYRPYRAGLSEAQWTSLALAAAVAAGAAAGILPGGAWAAIPALVLALAAGSRAARAPGGADLLGPRHVVEVAARLDRLAPSTPEHIRTARTSLGLRVSVGATADVVHYTVSADRGPIDDAEAGAFHVVV